MTDVVDDENNSQPDEVDPQPAEPTTDAGFDMYSMPTIQPSKLSIGPIDTPELTVSESQYDRWVQMSLLSDMGRDVGGGKVALPDTQAKIYLNGYLFASYAAALKTLAVRPHYLYSFARDRSVTTS